MARIIILGLMTVFLIAGCTNSSQNESSTLSNDEWKAVFEDINEDLTTCDKYYGNGKLECHCQAAMITESSKPCESFSVYDNYRGSCFSYLAVKTGDISYCENAGLEKNVCKAILSANVSACQKKLSPGMNESVDHLCIKRIAVLTKNETLCESAGVSKNSCYSDLAIIKEDASICELINGTVYSTGETWNEQCKTILQKDPSKCKENLCLSSIALLKNDASICPNIHCAAYVLQEKSMIGIYWNLS
jgi:hypothetical protein